MATGLVSGLALGTVAIGVPLTALAVYIGNNASWIAWQSKLWLFWVVIALVYVAGGAADPAWTRRNPSDRKAPEKRWRAGYTPGQAHDKGPPWSFMTQLARLLVQRPC